MHRILCFYSCLALILLSASCSMDRKKTLTEDNLLIRLNQVGFGTQASKMFITPAKNSQHFKVIDNKGKAVYSGETVSLGYWDKSGEHLFAGDFTLLETTGTFRVEYNDTIHSCDFKIDIAVYDDLLNASIKSFYYQRCSFELEEKYAGDFIREAGHPDDSCYYHHSTGKSGGFGASPGGWYDAGDYNKYVVNTAITLTTLLSMYEILPQSLQIDHLNIPESGNKTSDLLDECRYSLEWMLTMQDIDGGVFHKLSSTSFESYVMPHKANNERLFIGKSTAATLGFASTMALAYRVFKDVDDTFSNKCGQRAVRAWEWAKLHPEEYFLNPDDVNTGAYSDQDLSEEFILAETQLFISELIPDSIARISDIFLKPGYLHSESWRLFNKNIAEISVLTTKNRLTDSFREHLMHRFLYTADSLSTILTQSPHYLAIDEFVWGSNSDVLNTGLIFSVAHYLTGEKNYLINAQHCLDFVLGRNPTGYCFVTGFGCKSPQNIHHRPSIADGLDKMIPGFVVGGPNQNREDKKWLESNGVAYIDTFPAMSYVDSHDSYASNEVCLNWSAPLVALLAYINHNNLNRSQCYFTRNL